MNTLQHVVQEALGAVSSSNFRRTEFAEAQQKYMTRGFATCATACAATAGGGGACYTSSGDIIKCNPSKVRFAGYQFNQTSLFGGVGLPSIAEYPRYGVHHTNRVRAQANVCVGKMCVQPCEQIYPRRISPYGTQIDRAGLYGCGVTR